MSTVTTSTGVGGSSVAVTPHTSQVVKMTSKSSANAPEDHSAFVTQLLGDGARVDNAYRSVDFWQGNSMSSTGLAYNISGRATVIEAGVGERLAGFVDPIKAIFGTAICHDKTVIVKRKYVVGGQAIITPERAPARTVQVREDVTTVELQRYGGDIEMNTNLFLLPGEAQAELDMKLDAQKRELERKLIQLGYAEIFAKAVRLPDAVVRSNPTFVNKLTSAEAARHARNVYFRGCFGAFAKHEFPLANILAACKTATAYTSATAPGSVLILPHGSPEMLQYTKKSSLDFNISGLKTTDHKPITMSIDSVAEDPSSGVKIMVHHPMPTYRNGSAVPSSGQGLLSENVTLYMHYPQEAECYPDLTCGNGWNDLPHSNKSQLFNAFEHTWGTEPSSFDGNIGIDSDFIATQTKIQTYASMTGGQLFDKLIAFLNSKTNAITADSFIASLDKLSNSGQKYGTDLVTKDAVNHIKANQVPQNTAETKQYFSALLLWLAYNTRGQSANLGGYYFPKFCGAIQQHVLKKLSAQQVTIWQMIDVTTLALDKEGKVLYDKIMAKPTTPFNTLVKQSGSAGDNRKRGMRFRKLVLKMSSAILAAGGSDTGELLVGYPMTGVSTNARTESMTIALRVYLGAVLKRPENVVVIPHVAFEGIVDDNFISPKNIKDHGHPSNCGGIELTLSNGDKVVSYAGTWKGGGACNTNSGPLGHLDDPHYAELVQGLQIYKPSPVPVSRVGFKPSC